MFAMPRPIENVRVGDILSPFCGKMPQLLPDIFNWPQHIDLNPFAGHVLGRELFGDSEKFVRSRLWSRGR